MMFKVGDLVRISWGNFPCIYEQAILEDGVKLDAVGVITECFKGPYNYRVNFSEQTDDGKYWIFYETELVSAHQPSVEEMYKAVM